MKPYILIADDDSLNIKILTTALQENYNILTALNGQDALSIALNNTIDLILLDIMMPVMDGYEACRLLKLNEKTKDIPIIFLSGLVSKEDEIKGLRLGAVDYITKPFYLPIVKMRVATHIKLQLQQQELERLNNALLEHQQNLQEQVNARTLQIDIVNKRLRTANDELTKKTDELALSYQEIAQTNAILQANNHELLKTNERLRLWENNALDFAVISIDTVGRIISWNAGAQKIIGYYSAEVLGQNFEMFYANENKSFKNALESTDQEHFLIKKDGSKFAANIVTTPLYDSYGKLHGYSVLAKDITEKKLAEEKLKAANERLQEAVEEEIKKRKSKDELLQSQSKLAMMGEMIAMIAHQWRQPLSHISSLTASIRMRALMGVISIDNESKEKLQEIENTTQHLSETIDDFRNFSKPNERLEEVDIAKALDSSVSMLEAALKTNSINLDFTKYTGLTVVAHSRELMQVFINIIKNGIDILVQNKIKQPYIKIRCEQDVDNVHIFISDNGGGIPVHLLPDKLFEPYVSTKGNVGTGLGLYMSKTIIDEHCGGELSVSNDDLGAVFKIKLLKNTKQGE